MNNAVGSSDISNHLELPPYPGVALADIHLIGNRALSAKDFAALMAAEVIGFDTESKPTFRKGEISTGPHLVQLAIDMGVYLFQVTHLQNGAELKTILESPKSLKVGFGLGNDHTVLKTRLDIEVNNVLDLGEVLRGPGRGTVGAKMAVASFFGQKLQKSKRISTSNWAAPQLSAQQMLYAANDALVALQVYRAWAHNPSPQANRSTRCL